MCCVLVGLVDSMLSPDSTRLFIRPDALPWHTTLVVPIFSIMPIMPIVPIIIIHILLLLLLLVHRWRLLVSPPTPTSTFPHPTSAPTTTPPTAAPPPPPIPMVGAGIVG